MPDYNLESEKIQELSNGLTYLLNEDIDLLFGYRLGTILEALQPDLKALGKAVTAHDKKYRKLDKDENPIPMKRAGLIIGNMVDPAQADEAKEALEKIMEVKKGFTCPDIPMAELLKAHEEDNIPIPGWVTRVLRPLLNVEGVDLTKAGEPKPVKTEAKKKPRGRAASKKAAEAEE